MANDEKSAWTKIGFRQSVDDLIQRGPTIDVLVAAHPFQGGKILRVLAQVDTGAAGTAISPRLVRKLGLTATGPRGEIREAGREPIIVDYFGIRLTLPNMDIELDAAGLPAMHPPHDILIGRDVLAQYRLAVDFTSGTVALHFKNASS